MKQVSERNEDEISKPVKGGHSTIAQDIYSDNGIALLTPKPSQACVRDRDNYIVCGPIVGYERPTGDSPIKLDPIINQDNPIKNK